MRTYVADMTNPEVVYKVEEAYYNLFTHDLQCVEQKLTPEHDHLVDPRVKVVVAEEAGRIVGVMMVDNDNVLFPVLSGDLVATLKALSLQAFEANGGYLEFQTQNDLICQLALAMNIPEIQHDGHFFWWGEKPVPQEG